MGLLNSLLNIKNWFAIKTGFSDSRENNKRKYDEHHSLASKRARMDNSLVEIVEISDESLSETEEVEIMEPGPSTVPLRASPPVYLDSVRHKRRTLSPIVTIDLTSSSDEEKKVLVRSYSLSNPSRLSSRIDKYKKSTNNKSSIEENYLQVSYSSIGDLNSSCMESSMSSMQIDKNQSKSSDERILGMILNSYVIPKSKSEISLSSAASQRSPLISRKQTVLNQSAMSKISGKENLNFPELSFYKNKILEKENFYSRVMRKFKEKQAAAAIQNDIKKKTSDDVFLEKLQSMNKLIEKVEPKKKIDVFPGYGKDVIDFLAKQMAGPQNEYIIKGKNIKKSDLRTIYSPTAWLNDEVINHYMNMIVERDPNLLHSFDTFFYTKLSSQGYESVRRWSRRKDIFSCKKMFSPIHLGNHWCLVCVNFVEKTIKYYDSLGGKNPKCLNVMFYYLKEEHKNKKNEELDCTNWRLMDADDCPKQRNGYDCGVFACINAEFLARDAKLDFTQEDMPKLRHRVCYEILKNRLCF